MGKKKTAIVGDMLSTEDQEKLDRQKRQKESAKLVKQAEKGIKPEAKVEPPATDKHSEKAKDASADMVAQAEAAEKKTQDIIAAAAAEKAKEAARARVARSRGKTYRAARSKVEPKNYLLKDALKLLRDVSFAKMDGTVELHMTVLEKGLTISLDLPFSTGKTKKIAIASAETMAKIEKGAIDFDVLLATPAQMGQLVKFAKVLGPKGLMPNPKNGTITADPESTAKKMAASVTVTLKTEKDAPVVHTIVGKLSQKDEDLTGNINAIFTAYGNKLLKATMKSTMSPGIKLEIPKL